MLSVFGGRARFHGGGTGLAHRAAGLRHREWWTTRETFANQERFPMAQDIYTSYEDAFEKIQSERGELTW